ncbi:MAG: hypothetical protein J0I69_13285 [Altererythrobacter sp.]|nr:hypothetical protein [Altererythrobacter sp.]
MRGTEPVHQKFPLRFQLLLIVTRMGRDYRPGLRQRTEQVARKGSLPDLLELQRRVILMPEEEIHIPDFSDKNVFEMYVANGMRPGFWLRRTTWGSTCARVVDVGEIKGPAPYFGNPKVYADIHDLRTGELKEARARIPAVRRQNIRHNSRRRLAECGPRQGVDVRRRTCGAASADVRWSVA